MSSCTFQVVGYIRERHGVVGFIQACNWGRRVHFGSLGCDVSFIMVGWVHSGAP